MDDQTQHEHVAGESNKSCDGLSADELELRAQGHVGELRRQFSLLSALSLAFSITNSWVGYSATFLVPLLCSGGPGVFFGLAVAAIPCTIITAGLAELASAFPSSGGQYHFAYMVSDSSYRAPVAFTVGWLSLFAWWMTNASAYIYCAQIIVGIASTYNPDYEATQWQTWLVYVALYMIGLLVVTLFPKHIPKAEIGFFFISVVGFAVSFVTVLAVSDTKKAAREVFADWNNQSGWTDGFAFMIGVGQAMYSFLATDAATHVAEEMPRPGRSVPRVMGLTMIIGILTSFCWTLAFLFSATDYDEISGASMAILVVYQQALQSRPAAVFFTVWVLAAYMGSSISGTLTAGRLTWAFARDNGLPFSDVFKQVHPTLKTPVKATLLTVGFCCIYGLLYIASTTAFNSFIALSILGLNISYAIPQAIVLFRGRQNILRKRYFSLGNVIGPLCNAFSVLWMLLYSVIFCFPSLLPVMPDNMNYLSVVVAAVCLFMLGLWFGGKRKTFTGPELELAGICPTATKVDEASYSGYVDDHMKFGHEAQDRSSHG